MIEANSRQAARDRVGADSDHSVLFYEDDRFLAERLADFVGEGLSSGEPALVIATADHKRALTERLRAGGADVEGARATGRLTLLDAEDVLSRFMVGAFPDWRLFRDYIEGVVRQTRARRGASNEEPRLRAFGEMVDVLWRRGNAAATIRLEDHWNKLAQTHSFSLLCGYSMTGFHDEAHSESFRRVCAAHHHVHPAESYRVAGGAAEQLREVAMLQQRALALEAEVRRREALEVALREALHGREQSERAAQEADRRKDEFLAMLGHELRNPLAPILTALQLMQLRGPGSSDREQKVIERQVRHLVRLVDDLLDVSRITRGKVELKIEPVELASVLAKAVEMASPIFEQRSHSLSMDVAREGLLLAADPVRLGQVLSNLLTNAAKYTDPGGRIDVSARREGDTITLRVKDDGMGIAQDLLPNVFELFVQGHRTIDRSQGGLGIGLTLARNLVELHGGQISVHSDGLGKGTEFVVNLPAMARRPQPAVATARNSTQIIAAAVEVATQPRPRVLLVDDNVDAADVLAESLRAFGHEVAVAHDGPQALRLAQTFAPQIAILDIGLPVMDGYELAAKLREMAFDTPRLIALTGYGQESDKAKSRLAGFDVHLVKPVSLGTIVSLLEE